MTGRASRGADALSRGDRAVLVAPSNPVTTRFNIGIKAFSAGLSVRISTRDSAGAPKGAVERTFTPDQFVHTTAEALIGMAPAGNDSITFELLDGGGVIYGAATDNKTNDPNIQYAARITDKQGETKYIVPVAGSVLGALGSNFKTALQLHNPSDTRLDVSLTFRPAGGRPAAVTEVLSVAPFATRAVDLGTDVRVDGIGSLDLATSGTLRPIAVTRVYNQSAAGETSLIEELVAGREALRAGERGIVIAPHDPARLRMNLGVRTLESGVRMRGTVRSRTGAVIRTVDLEYGPDFFTQTSAESQLGIPLGSDETVTYDVLEGSAVVYAVWTDNITQDPSLQVAQRP